MSQTPTNADPATADPTRSLHSRRTFLRGAGATLGLAVAGGLLAACGESSPSSGSSSQAGGSGGSKRKTTTSGTFLAILPMTSLTYTPEYIADTTGLFTKYGLDLSFQTTHGSAPAINTIIANKALLTRVGDIETMVAISKHDAPLLNVGPILRSSPIRIACSGMKPIKSPQDMKGKTIGLPSVGGTSETILDLVLADAGIPVSSIKKQAVGGFSPSSYSLISSGRLDGYVVSIDIGYELQRQHPDAFLFDPSEFIKAGQTLYMTSKSTAKNHGDAVRAYMAAIKDAIDLVVGDADNDFRETIKILKKSDYEIDALKDSAVTRKSLAAYVDSYTRFGKQNILKTVPKNWTASYQELVHSGTVPGGKSPAGWFSNDYVPA